MGSLAFFFALLFSSAAGSVFLFFWYLIRMVLDRWGQVRLSFCLLKLTLLAWLPPFFYFVILSRIIYEDGSVRGYLLSPSSRIERVLGLGLFVWMLGVIAGLLYFFCWKLSFPWKERDYVEENQNFNSLLNDCKKKTGLRKKVITRQCYGLDSPMVYGIFRPVVLLPVNIGQGRKAEIVLVHELVHVRQRDLLVKRLAYLILLLHWMNPLAWEQFRLIQKWGEFSCDCEACEIFGKPKEYFQTILEMAMKEPFKRQFQASLFENKHQVLERVKKMDSYRKAKKKGRAAVLLLVGVAMLAGGMTSLAAGEGIVNGYDRVYQAMAIEQEEVMHLPEYIEYIETAVNPRIKVETDNTSSISEEGVSRISWSVENMVSKQTLPFSASEGGSILVSVSISPSDREVKVGIVTPKGVKRYVKGTEAITYKFKLDASGEYRVFAENTSGITVQVDGFYVAN